MIRWCLSYANNQFYLKEENQACKRKVQRKLDKLTLRITELKQAIKFSQIYVSGKVVNLFELQGANFVNENLAAFIKIIV